MMNLKTSIACLVVAWTAAVVTAGDKPLAEAWASLDGNQPSAEAAKKAFVAAGDEGVKFLLERMTGVPEVEKVRELIKQTDDDKFSVREKASEALAGMGRGIEPEVRAALGKEGISLECKGRLEGILEKIGKGSLPDGERRRQQAAVEAMRLVGSAEAKAALRKLSQVSAWPEVRALSAEAADGLTDAEIERMLTAAELATRKGDFAAAVEKCRDANAISVKADGLSSARVAEMAAMVEHRQKTAGEIEKLKARIAADAKDAMARMELVWLLLREMDQPAEAAKWLNDAMDTKIREMVTLAAKVPTDVPHDRGLDLARWYRSISSQAAEAARGPLLRKAAKLVELYLAGESAGPSREKAAAELDELQSETAALDAGCVGGIDLLKEADLAKHVRSGEWKRDGRGVKLAAGSFGVLELPAQPKKSYELRVQFNRAEGKDGIFVAVPAGEHRGDLNISGWGGECSGLEWIDGKEANENESTVKQPSVLNGRNHLLVVRVTLKDDEADVQTTMDGKAFVKWKGKTERLQTAGAWGLGDGTCLAIGAHQSEIRFLSVRLRDMGAKAK